MSRAVWVVLIWLAALGAGFGLATYGFWLSSKWNSTLVMSDISAKSEVSVLGHQRLLRVKFHVSGVQQCPSWTQHTLYRDMADAKADGRIDRTVVPLGITVNGFGAPDGKTDFNVPFSLPVSVESGAWNYTAITSISCEYLPGLTRTRYSETTPITVFVSGPSS